MISIKSAADIVKMEKACVIARRALDTVGAHIKVGVSTKELDTICENFIRQNGATPSFKGYGGFKGSICASINEQVIHGIPSKSVIIKDGDIVKLDVGAYIDGFHGDCARTFGVGNVSEADQNLIKVTRESFFHGIKFAKVGNRISDIGNAIESYCLSFGYGVVKDFTGHGIGRDLHEDPSVPNYGEAGRGVRLKAGMTLAIEPMINRGTGMVKILADGWTVVTADGSSSAHYENTILITENEPLILTHL